MGRGDGVELADVAEGESTSFVKRERKLYA